MVILLFSGLLYCQEKNSYFSASAGFDIKNAVLGSKPTNNLPSLDLLIGLHAVSGNFELNPEFELFEKIKFRRYAINIGWHFPRYLLLGNKAIRITTIPSLGTAIIARYGGEDRTTASGHIIYRRSQHLAFQGNLSFRATLSDRFLLDYTIQATTRPDLNFLYPDDKNKQIVFSNFIKVHYILFKN